MKKLFIILFIACSFSVQAQSKATLTMLKQISLLETYIGYLEKGYDIARKGLQAITDIKDGHWKMDTRFFNALKNVNPNVRGYTKVAAILDQQARIVKICTQLKKQDFNNDETQYINTVITHLLNECEGLVDKLALVITSGQLQMSDDERIRQIDRIYDAVSDQYSFIKDFYEQAKLLIRGRGKEKNDSEVSKKLRGL